VINFAYSLTPSPSIDRNLVLYVKITIKETFSGVKRYANGAGNDGYVKRRLLNHYGNNVYCCITIAIFEKTEIAQYGLWINDWIFNIF